MTGPSKKSDGKFVLMCFVAFFSLIFIVNIIFIYSALTSYSGVVTKNPYEKGLAFNDTLNKASSQPDIDHKVSYMDGVLRWELPMHDSLVVARIIRPVRDGNDFNVTMPHTGNGVYEAKLNLPMSGIWTANLKVTWNGKEFQTRHDFMKD